MNLLSQILSKVIGFFVVLLVVAISSAQVFIPFGFWGSNNTTPLQICWGIYCGNGINVFVAYDGINQNLIQLDGIGGVPYSVTGSPLTYCFGQVCNGGPPPNNSDANCSASGTYGTTIDNDANIGGSINGTAGEYIGSNAGVTVTSLLATTGKETCKITDAALTTKTATMNYYNNMGVTLSTSSTICVGTTSTLTSSGGLGTKTWAITAGSPTGTLSTTTGVSTDWTAPGTPTTVTITTTDGVVVNELGTPLTKQTNITASNLDTLDVVQWPLSLGKTTADMKTIFANIPYVSVKSSGDTTIPINNSSLKFQVLKCGAGGNTSWTLATTKGTLSPTGAVAANTPVTFTANAVGGSFDVTTTPVTTTINAYEIVPIALRSTNYSGHMCGLYDSKDSYSGSGYLLKCWGANTKGQLGNGDATKYFGVLSSGDDTGFNLPFVDVSGNSALHSTGAQMIKDVAVGYLHTCTIMQSNDNLKCWGNNSSNELGNASGISNPQTKPSTNVILDSSGSANFLAKKVFAMNYVTCAIDLNDDTYCWGDNRCKQISSSASTSLSAPQAVSFGAAKAVKLAGTANNICALLNDYKTVKCWGKGDATVGNGGTCKAGNTLTTTYYGELGDTIASPAPGNKDPSQAKIPISAAAGGGSITLAANEYVNNIVATNLSFCAGIVSGDATTAANNTATLIKTACWGRGSNNQLKPGAVYTTNTATPQVTNVNFGTTYTTYDMMANERTMHLLGSPGSPTYYNIQSWGRNDRAQALQGNTTDPWGDTAGELQTLMKLGTGRTVKSAAAGYRHGCAILDNDGLKCWGYQYCIRSSSVFYGCLLRGEATNTGAPLNIGDVAGESGNSLLYSRP
ncbi:MAG: hypothetical protein ABL930_04310 [Pseudobdellovibrio sp.]